MITRTPRRIPPATGATARREAGLFRWALALGLAWTLPASALGQPAPATTQAAAPTPTQAAAPTPTQAAAPTPAKAAAPTPAKAAVPAPAKAAAPTAAGPVAASAMPTAAAATVSAAVPAIAARPPLPQVVDNVQKVYERTNNLKARFAQTLESAMGKRQASGVLRLKKPGKMRWDYEKPERKLFVTDGAMLWMYEPEDEQAFRQPLNSSQLPAQVSFLFGKGRLSDEFDITYLDGQKLGAAGDFVLKLVPKKATAQYKHLVFVVDSKTFMVKETVLYDQQGGSNHIVFSAIETNLKTDLDDSRFSFTPPANTKIINPR